MTEIVKISEQELEELGILYEELSDKPTNMEKMRSQYNKLIRDDKYYLLGAKNDKGELIGTVMGIICYDLSLEGKSFLVVENLIVRNKSRQSGIGKLLMEYLEKIAKEKECYYSILVSASGRKEAHIFYEKLGYSREIAYGFKKYI